MQDDLHVRATEGEALVSRRTLFNAAAASAALFTLNVPAARLLGEAKAAVRSRSPEDVARDETFWFAVQQAFTIDPRYILLNAGASNPNPRPVLEAQLRTIAHVNSSPFVHTYVPGLMPQQTAVRERLAASIGCSPAEVALVRNTTEGMNIAINGLPMAEGDEILATDYEYYSVMYMLEQRSKRERVNVRLAAIPQPARDRQDLTNAIVSAIGPRTKAIVISHIVNATGQIMPVAEIAKAARQRGVTTIVDGALAYGQIPVNVSELGCDAYATSLHKWLLAPLGTGLLYVRKDRIADLWPLFGAKDPQSGDVTKFETLGTRSFAEIAAAGYSLDFLESIGIENKAARLRYLKSYWADQLSKEPRIRFGAGLQAEHSAAMVQMSIDGIGGRELSKHLLDRHRIYAFGPMRAGAHEGIYVAPNVFTRLGELDAFVAAIRTILKNGIA